MYYGGRYSQESGSQDEEDDLEEYGQPELGEDDLDPKQHEYETGLNDHTDWGYYNSTKIANREGHKFLGDPATSNRSYEEAASEASLIDSDRFVYFEPAHRQHKQNKPERHRTAKLRAAHHSDEECSEQEEDNDIIIAEVEKKSWKWREAFDDYYEEEYEADVDHPTSNPPTEEESKYNSADEVEQLGIDSGQGETDTQDVYDRTIHHTIPLPDDISNKST